MHWPRTCTVTGSASLGGSSYGPKVGRTGDVSPSPQEVYMMMSCSVRSGGLGGHVQYCSRPYFVDVRMGGDIME
jgi:hypothetical protein